MGYLFNSLAIFLQLKQNKHIGPNCRMLDLGSQDFLVRSESELEILQRDMSSFVGTEAKIKQEEFMGYVPANRIFATIGIDYCCLDVDGRNDSIYLDLNFRELDRSLIDRFDLICNQGTSEHLINQGSCYANIHDMMRPGGIFYGNVPFLGHQNHGQVNLTLKFWNNLMFSNGYTPISMYIDPPSALPADQLIPEGLKAVQWIDLMPPESSNFHIILKKHSDEPFIFPIDAVDSAVDHSWYRKLIASAMTLSYVRPGLMDPAEVPGHVNRAMQRLFPHALANSPGGASVDSADRVIGRRPPIRTAPAAGAAGSAALHEADFRTVPVAEIVQRFAENGSVLLRNFVDPARALELKRVLDKIYEDVQGPHVFGEDLKERGLPDIHYYVFSDKQQDLLNQVFDGQYEVYNTSARRVEPPGLEPAAGEVWQAPLSPHLDAFFHGVPFTVNFWVPLDHCGADTPRLGVVRAPFSDVLDFVGYHDEGLLYLPDPELNFQRFNSLARQMFVGDEAAVTIFRSRYGDCISTPQYRLGDAMLLSNWTLHFTHAQPGMSKRRENVELRFRSNNSAKPTSLADFLERRIRSAATAFTFAEVVQAETDAGPNSEFIRPPEMLPSTPQPVQPDLRSMEGERELSTGMLAKGASFRLIVKGQIGAREIDRLISKLKLDREILADEDRR